MQYDQDQSAFNQMMISVKNRIAMTIDWNRDKQKMVCMDSKQNIHQSMQTIIASLNDYPHALRELRQQNNSLDVTLTMSTQEFFYWLMSDAFQKSCLIPQTIQMQSSLESAKIKLHVLQKSYA